MGLKRPPILILCSGEMGVDDPMYGPLGDALLFGVGITLLLLLSAAVWYPLVVRSWRKNQQKIESADEQLQEEARFTKTAKEASDVNANDSMEEMLRKMRLKNKERGRLP